MANLIVLATSNKNKIIEFRKILDGFPIELPAVSDFGPIPEPIEDGKTFDENAYKKAFHTARVLGLPAIADDSGLVVPSLNGEPGVFSSRYAGPDATDEQNIQKLLLNLRGVTDRRAYFKCVLSIAVPSGPALTYEAQCDGILLDEKRGARGFGYDPIFYIEELGKTLAELSLDQKNSLSHRGKALAEFSTEISKVLEWIDQRLFEEKPPKPDHNEFLSNDWSLK